MKSSGEALSVSYTVATLDARSKMSRMRTLLSLNRDEARAIAARLLDAADKSCAARS
jgi:hypothetical protein